MKMRFSKWSVGSLALTCAMACRNNSENATGQIAGGLPRAARSPSQAERPARPVVFLIVPAGRVQAEQQEVSERLATLAPAASRLT